MKVERDKSNEAVSLAEFNDLEETVADIASRVAMEKHVRTRSPNEQIKTIKDLLRRVKLSNSIYGSTTRANEIGNSLGYTASVLELLRGLTDTFSITRAPKKQRFTTVKQSRDCGSVSRASFCINSQ
jgi:hypothetical protein